jgi:hypothetical protein
MIEAKPENLIGDRAYDSDPLDEELRREGIEMIAPHRANLSVGLAALQKLKIRTCAGFFSDFVKYTKNRISIHIRSSAIDWRLNYELPSLADEILFGEITARIPDLSKEHGILGIDPIYAGINDLTYDAVNGGTITVPSKDSKYSLKRIPSMRPKNPASSQC